MLVAFPRRTVSSATVDLWKWQADCIVMGPCPYGCAYGAGPASNKVKWFCGFGGISFYPSIGFVLSWSWVTFCFWQLSPAHGRYIGLPHKKCLGRFWRYTLWRLQHSRQDGLVSQTYLCLMRLDKGGTHACTSQS
jgi:hypothetical protein